MNYLANADASLANFQTVLSQYSATIAPPGSYSDCTVFLLLAAGVGVVLLVAMKA